MSRYADPILLRRDKREQHPSPIERSRAEHFAKIREEVAAELARRRTDQRLIDHMTPEEITMAWREMKGVGE